MRTQKLPTALNLLNNTMPMPKLMIDLASPSTGGSTDVISGTKTATGQAGGLSISAKDVFKNNLARAAKSSAAAAQLQSNAERAVTHKKSASLKKQMLNH